MYFSRLIGYDFSIINVKCVHPNNDIHLAKIISDNHCAALLMKAKSLRDIPELRCMYIQRGLTYKDCQDLFERRSAVVTSNQFPQTESGAVASITSQAPYFNKPFP